MKRLNRTALLIATAMIASPCLQAQTISGQVTDSLSGAPLPDATIALAKNSTVVTTINTANGDFTFSGLDTTALYTLSVRFTGYHEKVVANLSGSQRNSINIQLVPQQKEMAGVTVSSGKPFIMQKNDKITVNVAQSPLAAGGNAYEAVKKAPGITDIQGLQFRGKNVTVYINDKPSRLGGEELKNYLISMPANTVERVEVIPNPSAKYEASGGPVINIILAKSKDLGTNGVLTAGAGAGRYPRFNNGISLNHRTATMNIYGSYDYQQTRTRGITKAERSFNELFSISDEQRSYDKGKSHNAKTGIDYTINKQSSIGALVRGSFINRDRYSQNISLSSNDSSSLAGNNGNTRLSTIAANIYYKTKISKQGELSLNADYFSYDKTRRDQFATRYFDEKGTEYNTPYFLRAGAPANNRITSFSADYSFSQSKISYETGLKAVLTRTDNVSDWEKNEAGTWENDELKSNRFIYKENIYAAYLSASRSIGKFDVQAGVRAEMTDANGYSVTLKQENDNNYTSLFPSLSVSFNRSEQQQYSFSYRRKIERFGFDIVNPFILYQNQYAYYQGNPFIRPSFSHNFELAWASGNEWMVAADYGHFTDALAEVYKKAGNGDAMISTYENIASADQLSLSLTYTKMLFNGKLNTSNTLGGLYARYNAPAETGLSNAATTLMISSTNMISIGKVWKAEVAAWYYSPMQFGAYDFKSQFSSSLGLSRTLFNKKATLGLSVTDLFNTNKQHYTAASYETRSTVSSLPETRFIKLNFSYKFGNKNVKAAKNRQTGIEEVKRRMAN